MPVILGTSGWQYAHWKSVFYPKGVPQRVWLEHHASLFQSVESQQRLLPAAGTARVRAVGDPHAR